MPRRLAAALVVLVFAALLLLGPLRPPEPTAPPAPAATAPAEVAKGDLVPDPAAAPPAAAAADPAATAQRSAAVAGATTGELLVTVVWPDQTPATGLAVDLLRPALDRLFDLPRTITDERGQCRFADLAPGRARPLVHHGEAHAGPRVEIEAGGRHEVRVEMPAGIAVQGRVVDDTGAAVPSATLLVADWGGGRSSEPLGTTDSEGRFALRHVHTPTHLGARKAGHQPSSMHTIMAAKGADVSLTIVLPRGGAALAGTVLGPDGQPVPHAVVRAGKNEQGNHKLPDGGSAMAPQPMLTRTDASGRFAFASLPVGTLPLAVRAKGLAPAQQTVELAAGRTGEATVRLQPGVTLHGAVRDGAGAGIAGADLRVGDWDEVLAIEVTSTADGSYRLEGGPVGKQRVAVSHSQQGRLETELEFVAGETRRWDPVLDGGLVLRGRLVDDDGKPVKAMLDASLRPPQAGDRFHGFASSGDDGRFEIRNCPPGRALELGIRRKGTFAERVVTGVVPGPEELVIRLANPRWAHVEGTVRGPDGKVLPNVTIATIRETDYGGSPIDQVDPQTGAFQLGPFPPGRYTLRFEAPGFPPLQVSRDLAPDETWQAGTLQFAPGGHLRVQLLSADSSVDLDRARLLLLDSAGRYCGHVQPKSGAGQSELLAPGEHFLLVAGSFAAQRVPFAIRAGEVTQLEVPVQSGIGVAIDCPEPVGDATVRRLRCEVRDASGACVWSGDLWREGERFAATVTLAKGRYRVRADHGDFAAEASLDVGDAPTQAQLRAAPR